MSSAIRSIITDTLQERGYGQYLSYAEPVIEALEDRERIIKGDLRAFAESKGLASQQVTDLFIEVGLEEPEPEPVQTLNEGDDVTAQIASLSQQIAALTERLDRAISAASRHGVHV